MHILHWKVIGDHWRANHELASEYYEKLEEFLDEVAEILLMNGDNVLSLTEILKTADGDQENEFLLFAADKEYNEDEFYTHIKLIFTQLVELYDKCYDRNELTNDVISKLQEHQYYLRKELTYKVANQLKNK